MMTATTVKERCQEHKCHKYLILVFKSFEKGLVDRGGWREERGTQFWGPILCCALGLLVANPLRQPLVRITVL